MQIYGTQINSPLLLGTAQYPSPAVLIDAIRASGTQIVTVSLRRETAGGSGIGFFDLLKETGCRILPNTAGCHTAKEAITTAHMARDVFGTNWIKLEVIGHCDTLQPDVFGLVDAARVLSADGFEVFPYTTDDLVVGEKLIDAGCKVLMPWGAPIGSAQGLRTPDALRAMRAHFPDTTLIVDAGIGRPSDATRAMELGMDAVLLNTAVAKAGDPVEMARAMALAVEAGRTGYRADPMEPRDMAVPSTPVVGLGGTWMMEKLYLIVGHVDRLEQLIPQGVRLVQLRIKDQPEAELRDQISKARDICARYGTQLVVNDHWKIALDLRCDFVHLGQEDMDGADVTALRRAGVRIGISTHDEAELDRALSYDPDYVALGPVYPTLLKKMKWGPQGLDKVTSWKKIAGMTPLVAIGGLTPDRLPGVFAAGADSAAVVTDIQNAPDPEARCREWIKVCAS